MIKKILRVLRVLYYKVRRRYIHIKAHLAKYSAKKKLYVINRHRPMICCVMRDDDLLRMEKYFHLNNFVTVHDPALADILLVNTCAFDKERENNCLALIREFSQFPGDLLVTGCIGKINEKELRKVFSGTYISPPELEKKLDAFLSSKISLQFCFRDVIFHGKERTLYDGGIGWRKSTKPHSTPSVGTVKIVNGCPQNCAYCTHRMAIGVNPISVPTDKIIKIVEQQVHRGAKVIQLLADNLGAYGIDIRSNVPELVRQLTERFPGVKYALDQYHVAYFVRDYQKFGLRELFEQHFIYELTIPIQSGSNRVLEAMNRKTNLELLTSYLEEAIKLSPDMLLVTHIITGFPTETEAEFRESVKYVKKVFHHNSLVFIFPCSVHPNTLAALLSPRVPYEEALRRALIAEKELLASGIDVCLDQWDVFKERGECGLYSEYSKKSSNVSVNCNDIA